MLLLHVIRRAALRLDRAAMSSSRARSLDEDRVELAGRELRDAAGEGHLAEVERVLNAHPELIDSQNGVRLCR